MLSENDRWVKTNTRRADESSLSSHGRASWPLAIGISQHLFHLRAIYGTQRRFKMPCTSSAERGVDYGAEWRCPLDTQPQLTYASSPNASADATATRFDGTHRAPPFFTHSLYAILGGQAASGLLALVTEVAYARLLGPAARGGISLCMMSIAFGNLVGGLGGEGTIVYWASRSKNAQSSWLVAVAAWGVLGCLGTTILWNLAFWHFRITVLRGVSDASARVVMVSISAAVLFSYAMALASGTEQFRLRSLCASLRQLVSIVSFLILLLAFGRSVEIALWGNFAGLILGSLLALVLLGGRIRRFWGFTDAAQDLRPTVVYGVRGQLGNLASFFNYRLDVFVVNYFLDPLQLGFYALGVVISEALWQVPAAVASALFPRTARTVEEDATQFTCFLLRQVLLTTTLGGVAIAVLSPIAVPLIFGSRFSPSVAVIWWILPGTIALSLAKVACADLAGRGKNGYSSVAAFVSFAATAALDWFLIPRMGILGAALASSLAYSLDALLVLLALRYELGVGWKTLFIPTKNDLHAYKQALLRTRAFGRSLSSGGARSRDALAAEEVD